MDSLRPPKKKDQEYWAWREEPLRPVTFDALLESGANLLHLEHRFVQRILSRFQAQGHAAHDLSRVTIVRKKGDAKARVIAFGRLTLFGASAIRLHDELVSVAAAWHEGKSAAHLRPFGDEADRKAIETLEAAFADAPELNGITDTVRAKLLESAPGDFAALWPAIRAEAEARGHAARRKLADRGATEATALRQILGDQKKAIQKTLARQPELPFDGSAAGCRQREQLQADRSFMAGRLDDIESELEAEPRAIESGYRVALSRLVPVGLVYLWPATR